MKKAKITDFTFHDLRHTFASQLAMANGNIMAIKELLGHKSLAMANRYAHLSMEHKMNAVELLDAALRGKSTAQKLTHPESKRTAASG